MLEFKTHLARDKNLSSGSASLKLDSPRYAARHVETVELVHPPPKVCIQHGSALA